jgi:hypothetical protein
MLHLLIYKGVSRLMLSADLIYQTTGVLVQDQDAGFCPTNAVLVTGMSKRQSKAHAPLPTRPKNVVRGNSNAAGDKAYLKKRRATPKVEN